jgi:glycine/D-amino acid oxidase-like deaminating enzyme
VAIIGAGASGLWSAIELAPDHDVQILEAGRVGAGASGYAAGFVGPFESWAPYPDAITHSIEAFRELDGQHGFEFHERPYVELAETDAAGQSLRESYRPLLDQPGYEIEYYTDEELAERWPDRFDLSPFDGGLVKEESGIIHGMDYLGALATIARENGVEIRTQTPVEEIAVENGSVAGVETEDGVIEADTVVCTAGAQTVDILDPFVEIPIRPFIFCNLRVEADTKLPEDYPMMYAQDVWWRPEPRRPETFLVSGGMYFLPASGRPPRSPPSEYLREIESVLEALVHDIDSVRVINGSFHTCSKGSSITPDTLPIIDTPANAPDGLVVAAGVRAGISMSPFTGAAVRGLITGETPPVSTEPFSLDRFDDPPAEFQVYGVREMPSTFPTGTY